MGVCKTNRLRSFGLNKSRPTINYKWPDNATQSLSDNLFDEISRSIFTCEKHTILTNSFIGLMPLQHKCTHKSWASRASSHPHALPTFYLVKLNGKHTRFQWMELCRRLFGNWKADLSMRNRDLFAKIPTNYYLKFTFAYFSRMVCDGWQSDYQDVWWFA